MTDVFRWRRARSRNQQADSAPQVVIDITAALKAQRDVLVAEAEAATLDREKRGLSTDYGHKLAFLGIDPAGNLAFIPTRISSLRYSPSSDAECWHDLVGPNGGDSLVAGQVHASPDPMCSCGFYALRCQHHLGSSMTRSWLAAEDQNRYFVLEVDLSGRIIDGDLGFRAEHIEVLSVGVPNFCRYCWQLATGLSPSHSGKSLASCCDNCVPKRPHLSLAEVRERLMTEVKFIEPPWDNTPANRGA